MTIAEKKLSEILSALRVFSEDLPECPRNFRSLMGWARASRAAMDRAFEAINELIVDVRQLKAENEALRDGANHRAIQSLRADCEALRKDAERYRAIRDEIPHVDLGRAILDVQTADEYDSAVDAAMAKEADHG